MRLEDIVPSALLVALKPATRFPPSGRPDRVWPPTRPASAARRLLKFATRQGEHIVLVRPGTTPGQFQRAVTARNAR